MKFLPALLLAASITTSAIAQPAPAGGPTEYTLHVPADDVNWIGRGLDEMPAKVANPIVQRLLRQIETQNKAFEEAKKPKIDDNANPATPKQ